MNFETETNLEMNFGTKTKIESMNFEIETKLVTEIDTHLGCELEIDTQRHDTFNEYEGQHNVYTESWMLAVQIAILMCLARKWSFATFLGKCSNYECKLKSQAR